MSSIKPTPKPAREIWKKIPGFKNEFEVSNWGNVRKIKLVNGKLKEYKYKIQNANNKSGSPSVHLCNPVEGEKKYSYYYVIGLFMKAFHGVNCTGRNAYFKDGDRTNISTTNVEFVAESVAHAQAVTNKSNGRSGERNIYMTKHGSYIIQFFHNNKTYHAGSAKTLNEAIDIRDYWASRFNSEQNRDAVFRLMRGQHND